MTSERKYTIILVLIGFMITAYMLNLINDVELNNKMTIILTLWIMPFTLLFINNVSESLIKFVFTLVQVWTFIIYIGVY